MATDIVTLKTREDMQVHVDDLKEGFNKTLDALSRLQQHARGPEKLKWQRLATKLHRVINYADRVLESV